MSKADASSSALPPAATDGKGSSTVTAVERAPAKPPIKQLPPYNVILLDDDDHSYDYVIQMLRRVFGHPEPRGMQLAKEVDEQGRAILMTTHREHAELKRDQVHGFGADPRIAACRGSMTALIEPAESK